MRLKKKQMKTKRTKRKSLGKQILNPQYSQQFVDETVTVADVAVILSYRVMKML